MTFETLQYVLYVNNTIKTWYARDVRFDKIHILNLQHLNDFVCVFLVT